MAMTNEEQFAGWIAETKLAGFRRRNWPVVRRLAAVTTTLLLMSLPAEFVLGSRGVAAACWIAAAAAGTAMFAWFFDRRRFVE
ncbi:hypothetical protein KZX46_20975 (plasmid) [Polymorphobacter sp. PAMC 29334]|uniref:hypothetical protein n=1 Tax=Polymorphobacter sp. PAMC 29334 TaxID=2862331 RepID=UPI001C752629|nr:hypothetical protein [Polymorphobacter sp. PAMC 29334]QYE37032.1 hypothetical protein KZX46_20975 [Polymorphobacter sp. PAMC 29334]